VERNDPIDKMQKDPMSLLNQEENVCILILATTIWWFYSEDGIINSD